MWTLSQNCSDRGMDPFGCRRRREVGPERRGAFYLKSRISSWKSNLAVSSGTSLSFPCEGIRDDPGALVLGHEVSTSTAGNEGSSCPCGWTEGFRPEGAWGSSGGREPHL